jgi:hypothetical protein
MRVQLSTCPRVVSQKWELRARVGRMKTELDLLIEEIERGEWSNTAKPKKVPVESELEPTCWHCGGSGRCGCIACGVMKPSTAWDAGPCVPCQNRAKKGRPQ